MLTACGVHFIRWRFDDELDRDGRHAGRVATLYYSSCRARPTAIVFHRSRPHRDEVNIQQVMEDVYTLTSLDAKCKIFIDQPLVYSVTTAAANVDKPSSGDADD